MELRVLDGDTLKIVLTPEETKKAGISFCAQSASMTDGERNALRRLLEDASGRAGIDLVDRRIFVRICPLDGGGCELTVSGCDWEGTGLSSSPAETVPDSVCRVFSLRCAMRLKVALRSLGFSGRSETYLDGDGGCYLRVQGKYPPILSEFGAVLPVGGQTLLPWLKEHCIRLPEREDIEKE